MAFFCVCCIEGEEDREMRKRAGLSGFGFLLVAASGAAQTIPPAVYSQLQYRLLGPWMAAVYWPSPVWRASPAPNYFGAASGGVWKTTSSGLT